MAKKDSRWTAVMNYATGVVEGTVNLKPLLFSRRSFYGAANRLSITGTIMKDFRQNPMMMSEKDGGTLLSGELSYNGEDSCFSCKMSNAYQLLYVSFTKALDFHPWTKGVALGMDIHMYPTNVLKTYSARYSNKNEHWGFYCLPSQVVAASFAKKFNSTTKLGTKFELGLQEIKPVVSFGALYEHMMTGIRFKTVCVWPEMLVVSSAHLPVFQSLIFSCSAQVNHATNENSVGFGFSHQSEFE